MYWGNSTLIFGIVVVVIGVVEFLCRRLWAKRVKLILRTFGLHSLASRPEALWANLAAVFSLFFVLFGITYIILSVIYG